MKRTVQIPVSPEQEEVIADHLFKGGPLGMQPDERAWIRNHVSKLSSARVLSADLDVETAQWTVVLDEEQK